jgi:hypothetical protein
MKDLGNGTWRCPRCECEGGVEILSPTRVYPGYHSYCKTCTLDYNAEWAKANPEKYRLARGRHMQKIYRTGKAGDYFSKL